MVLQSAVAGYDRSDHLEWSHEDFYIVTELPKSLFSSNLDAYAKEVTQRTDQN